jgi:hypothetical protein
MNNANDVLDIIRTVADIMIIPLCGILWNVQGRLSRIEGMLTNRTLRPEEL